MGASSANVSQDQISRLYKTGLSCRKVAQRVGCSTSTVFNRLKTAGVKLRPPGNNDGLTFDGFISLRQAQKMSGRSWSVFIQGVEQSRVEKKESSRGTYIKIADLGRIEEVITSKYKLRDTDEVLSCLSNSEAGWLAGIIDGEGHIGLHCGSKKAWSQQLVIANTNKGIVEAIKDMLGKLGCQYTVRIDRTKSDKKCWYVGVWRFQDIATVCIAVRDHIHGKGREIDAMLELCGKRAGLGHRIGLSKYAPQIKVKMKGVSNGS